MPQQNKLTQLVSLTGISTVGIYTVGVTETAGGTGIGTTTYVRTALFHNAGKAGAASTDYAGLGTATCSLYIYPHFEEVSGVGKTSYRILRKDLAPNETYMFDLPSYPVILTDREKLVVEITKPFDFVGGTGIGTVINVQVFGDEDQAFA
tara:strand:- start:31 stop:480 length:450 start_codon:yes stop_codon:yes gene_type:complete